MNTTCPTCDAEITLPENTEVSEIISCNDCQTRLVVDAIGEEPQVSIAPMIEEDWGE